MTGFLLALLFVTLYVGVAFTLDFGTLRLLPPLVVVGALMSGLFLGRI